MAVRLRVYCCVSELSTTKNSAAPECKHSSVYSHHSAMALVVRISLVMAGGGFELIMIFSTRYPVVFA